MGKEFIIRARRVDGVGDIRGEVFRELEARETYWRVERGGVNVGVVPNGRGFRDVKAENSGGRDRVWVAAVNVVVVEELLAMVEEKKDESEGEEDM